MVDVWLWVSGWCIGRWFIVEVWLLVNGVTLVVVLADGLWFNFGCWLMIVVLAMNNDI